MATDISICSEALVKLGSRAITGFDGSTKGARLAEATYPTIREYMLGLKLWRFCTKTVDLSRVRGDPADPAWAYQYNNPAAMVRLHAVKDQRGYQHNYRLQEGRIFTNIFPAKATYQRAVVTPDFPIHFVMALVERCCFAWANTMTGEGRTVERFRRSRDQITAEAALIDGQNQEPIVLIDSPSGNSLIAARRGF